MLVNHHQAALLDAREFDFLHRFGITSNSTHSGLVLVFVFLFLFVFFALWYFFVLPILLVLVGYDTYLSAFYQHA